MVVNISRQQLFIFGFLGVFLVAIPATIYGIKTFTAGGKSQAAPSTTLSLTTTATNPKVGDTIPVTIVADPGTNAISVIQLSISYDSTKLSTASSGLVPNATAFPTLLNPVTYGPCTGNFCTITATLAIGADPTKAITTKTTVGTLTFSAIAATDPSQTTVSFGSNTTVFSVGSSDQSNENVLLSKQPLPITITNGSTVSNTSNAAQVNTASTTDTPTPTDSLLADASTADATSTPTATGSGSSTQTPVCSALSVDQSSASSGATLNFTANGNSPSGTIAKVTFNFGDSNTLDVTIGGGIGTNNVSVQQAHTYISDGTYTATAVMTDDSNNVSDAAECQQTVTIGAGGATISPMPTLSGLPLTGPGATFIGIGVGGVIVAFLGGLLFLGL